MNAAYTPQPGTVAFRVIAHLETEEPRAELTTAQLAEALGVAATTLINAMEPALDAGLVFRRQKHPAHSKSPLFWSLVDHSKPTGAAAASRRPETAKETTQRGAVTQVQQGPTSGAGEDAKREVGAAAPRGLTTEPSIQRPAVHTPVSARSEAAPAAQASGQGEGAATPNDGRSSHGMRIALWSYGALVIERDGRDRIVFDKAETRQLLDYLFRMEGTA